MSQQTNLYRNKKYPTYEEIIQEYSDEINNYIEPEGDNVFGFWMQTIADLQLLDLELQGLYNEYRIDPISRNVKLQEYNKDSIYRIAHLSKVYNKNTLYSEFVKKFDDTNAYALHNLYPYKGKFYPRVVRTLINAFNLNKSSIILDPFNGSGTTTHECCLMGIKSVGLDITPLGNIMSKVKNDLLFINEEELSITTGTLRGIYNNIKTMRFSYNSPVLKNLFLLIYFDTLDAFERTSSYKKLGKEGLFIKKFNYIKSCVRKINEIKEEYSLNFINSELYENDVLNLKEYKEFNGKFDAVITSPPYYFSVDYIGKDKVAYDYLEKDMPALKNKYLGMKASESGIMNSDLPKRVIQYYSDLNGSIKNIYWTLKSGGKLAILVGDSTVSGKKIPTSIMTKKFCESVGFKIDKVIFNPLLGARNRAIRGESIIICTKEE